MSDENLRETVERVGAGFDLGEYEIEAYLTVLQHGELTASEIADRTDIPQPRVYDTVRSLGDRGLVELRESRPMKVVALDPESAFEGLQSDFAEMVAALEDEYTAPARDTEAVSLVKSRSTIVRYFGEVIADAEFELVCSLTPSLLERFADDLAAAKDRGVSVDLVVTPSADAPDPERFDYGAVATTARGRRGITTPVVAVADGQYSVYATQGAVRDDPEKYGVIFNRSALGFLVSGFFGTVIWSTANRVLHDPNGAVSLPRTYASIRRCVKDLATIDGDVYATVRGRDVLTGEPRTDRGRVAETRLEANEEVATLVVETDSGPVEVGGRVAAYEDVEAHEITVARDAPPQA
ncbi:HTH-type sugar sensing transcriptional regulator TrmB [Halobacterium litoreum]|uniref:HTH-type sugar sensing transcriptional regulator TrmB n=1 Tax=Halobacterium litoreum TaxID=2039234 RepID=A0ABD5NCF1_9EURY|nr:TrmB family transcriptional regulator [Halobacterium litoreum]UHH14143.1 TrmB family transcriptional regulator [Halobacterium litoreum]